MPGLCVSPFERKLLANAPQQQHFVSPYQLSQQSAPYCIGVDALIDETTRLVVPFDNWGFQMALQNQWCRKPPAFAAAKPFVAPANTEAWAAQMNPFGEA